MLCKDPKCICHPRKPKPFQRLQLTLRGPNPDQVRRLDQPGAQLDIIFDLIGNNIHLREAIGDPEFRDTSYSINFFIESKMMQFENLKGLPNNDLLLSFRMRSSFCCAWGKNKMRYREKCKGFSPNKAESKLYNEFYQCDWPEQHLELLMPADRIMGWKTVALILKTFKRISPENWCRMVKLGKTKKFPRVAGLDWMAIEADVMPKKEVLPPTPAMTPEEEKKMYFFAQQKKIAAKRAYHQQLAALAI